MTFLFIILAIVLFVFIGGLISRMSGSSHFNIGHGLEQWLYAVPYALININAAWWQILLSYAGAFIGKRAGHGGGIDMGTYPHPRETEKLEYLIVWLRGRIPEYWYDALIMAVTGLAVSLVSGVVFAINVDVVSGIVLALSGATKGLAYMLGWAIYPSGHDGAPHDSEFDEATELAEFFTGVFGWLILCVIALAHYEVISEGFLTLIPAF